MPRYAVARRDKRLQVDATMAISLQCPGCAKKLKCKDELAGKRLKCPGCGQAVMVPQADATFPPSGAGQPGADVSASGNRDPRFGAAQTGLTFYYLKWRLALIISCAAVVLGVLSVLFEQLNFRPGRLIIFVLMILTGLVGVAGSIAGLIGACYMVRTPTRSGSRRLPVALLVLEFGPLACSALHAALFALVGAEVLPQSTPAFILDHVEGLGFFEFMAAAVGAGAFVAFGLLLRDLALYLNDQHLASRTLKVIYIYMAASAGAVALLVLYFLVRSSTAATIQSILSLAVISALIVVMWQVVRIIAVVKNRL